MAQILHEIQDHFQTHDIPRSIGYGIGLAAMAVGILFVFGPL